MSDLRETMARAVRGCPSVWTRVNDVKPWRWFECCRHGEADEPEIVVLSEHESEPEMLEALAGHIDELRVSAALAAIEAAGWQCVPKEATPDIRAAMRSAEKVPQTVDEAWANMLAAAPKP